MFRDAICTVPLSDDQLARLDQLARKRHAHAHVVGAVSRFAGSRLYPVIQFGADEHALERLDVAGNLHRMATLDVDILHERKDEVAWLLQQKAKHQRSQPNRLPSRTGGYGDARSSLAA